MMCVNVEPSPGSLQSVTESASQSGEAGSHSRDLWDLQFTKSLTNSVQSHPYIRKVDFGNALHTATLFGVSQSGWRAPPRGRRVMLG